MKERRARVEERLHRSFNAKVTGEALLREGGLWIYLVKGHLASSFCHC